MPGLCGWMLRSHNPRSTVEDTNNMCAKGTDIQLVCKAQKAKSKSQVKNHIQIKKIEGKIKIEIKN
jgi:hypothetical protein